jgi:hypothetical protein
MRSLALLIVVFFCGIAVGRFTWPQEQPRHAGSVVLPERVTDLPGSIVAPQAGLSGKLTRVADRVRYRDLSPERVYEAPRPVEVTPGVRHVGVPGDSVWIAEGVLRDPDETVDRLNQVSKRGERLSVYVHGDSSDFRFDFRLPSTDSDFDIVAGMTSRPLVRSVRCLLCAPRLSVEGGMLWSESPGGAYAAAEASVAALSRNVRVVGRAEFTASDGRVYAGLRYTF